MNKKVLYFLLFFLLTANALDILPIKFNETKVTKDKKNNNGPLSQADKDFRKKISDIKENQLQKVINFTPGFKSAVIDFFAYDWSNALKNAEKEAIQKEVSKQTARLQNDYNQVVLSDLITALELVGKQPVNQQSKKEFAVLLKNAKKAAQNLNRIIIEHKDDAQKNLSNMLVFAQLVPASYTTWDAIRTAIQNNAAKMQSFTDVVVPMLESNNTTNLENYLAEAEKNYKGLVGVTKSYEQAATTLLKKMRMNIQKGKNITQVANELSSLRNETYQVLKTIVKNVAGLSTYVGFISSKKLANQWVKLIENIKKVIAVLPKQSKKWQNRLETQMLRHKDVYKYLEKHNLAKQIERSFSVDAQMLKKVNAALSDSFSKLAAVQN